MRIQDINGTVLLINPDSIDFVRFSTYSVIMHIGERALILQTLDTNPGNVDNLFYVTKQTMGRVYESLLKEWGE